MDLEGSWVWCLDPVNSPELIGRLRGHGRDRQFEVAWVGEGWRDLVATCHARLETVFPDYELLSVKQKFGVLAYQALPHRWVAGETRWSTQEYDDVQEITEEFRVQSETTCEWCSAPGRLREWRALLLTLCDPCDGRFADPPSETHESGSA